MSTTYNIIDHATKHKLGILSKAFGYHRLSTGIHEELNDRVGIARDYSNIGVVLRNMGKLQEV